jgi:hypothetical protein
MEGVVEESLSLLLLDVVLVGVGEEEGARQKWVRVVVVVVVVVGGMKKCC